MISLRSDNRSLTQGAKYSYLSANYAAGVTSLIVVNGSDFAANDYLLLGEWGSQTSEIVQIAVGGVSGNTLTVGATSFAHPESTKVTIIKYNQVKYYRTTTTTFSSSGTELSGSPLDVQPNSYYTIYQDTTNTSGYGWFVFYNATTAVATTHSNYIPYADFAANTAKKILDQFFSLLNNKEQKLISLTDAFSWLQEAYAKTINELNLVNHEFTVATPYSLSVTSGTAEYAWPDYFSKLISVADSDGGKVEKVELDDLEKQKADSGNTIKYYLRGRYVGFAPTPSAAATYQLYYTTTPTPITSFTDYIYLPNDNYFHLIDYLMYKAGLKLTRADAVTYLSLFNAGNASMKNNSINQSESKDTWEIDSRANI